MMGRVWPRTPVNISSTPLFALIPAVTGARGDVVWDWRLYAPLPRQWAERSSVKKANQVVQNFDLAGKCYLYQPEIIRIAGQITYSMLNTAWKFELFQADRDNTCQLNRNFAPPDSL